jgi:pyruvate/2-oxoacid:ferredoxin oxidoreductase beta subunit
MAIKDYIRERFFPHMWCPGCGHGIVLNGMLHAIEAFRVFILPVMTFPAQLDPLPSNCGALEINAIRRRFPGPPWLVHARAPEVALARKLSQGTP